MLGKYNKEWLKEKQTGENARELEYLAFWGMKTPMPQRVFSNFYKRDFTVNLDTGEEQTFATSEQYFMYLKADLFGDEKIKKEILSTPTRSPKYHKSLGRKVRGFDQAIWDKEKRSIMKRAVKDKFANDNYLRSILLSTGDKILVEASPFDIIWGIGMREGKKNGAWTRVSNWRGENLLGFVLMEVRDELR